MPRTRGLPPVVHSPAYYHNHSVCSPSSFNEQIPRSPSQPHPPATLIAYGHYDIPKVPADADARVYKISVDPWAQSGMSSSRYTDRRQSPSHQASPSSPFPQAHTEHSFVGGSIDTSSLPSSPTNYIESAQRSPYASQERPEYNTSAYGYMPEEACTQNLSDHAIRVLVSLVMMGTSLSLLTVSHSSGYLALTLFSHSSVRHILYLRQ